MKPDSGLSSHFYDLLKKQGFDFFTGVPCSFLKEMIRILEDKEKYIPAVREDQAIGLASGAYLAGKKPVVLMQNSGFAIAINALASLNLIYKIPILMIISMRGFQIQDAPEHWVLGEATTKLLEDIGVPYRITEKDTFHEDISFCVERIEKERLCTAVLIRKGVLG